MLRLCMCVPVSIPKVRRGENITSKLEREREQREKSEKRKMLEEGQESCSQAMCMLCMALCYIC